MRFIVDTQLPFKLAMFLRASGHDCLHTTDTPQGHLLSDEEIVAGAKRDERIVITKDADFKDYYNLHGAPPRVLYLTFGNIANRDLLRFFEVHTEAITQLFAEGAQFVEFNREGLYVG